MSFDFTEDDPPAKPRRKGRREDAEDEDRPPRKTRRDENEDEDEDRPSRKARREVDEDEDRPPRKARRDEDEDDRPTKKRADRGEGGNPQDGHAAEELGLVTGFEDRALIRQVEDELSRGEVLHFVCRPSEPIARWQAIGIGLGGIVFGTIGGILGAVMLAGGMGGASLAFIPGIFLLVGVLIAILGRRGKLRQAARGYYAVTNQRAIVFHPSLLGSSGSATSYEPHDLRRMRVAKSWFVKDAGDLIFKTEVRERRTDYVDRRTGQTVRSETSRQTTHYGFLGIENVRAVESLVHEVLLSQLDD